MLGVAEVEVSVWERAGTNAAKHVGDQEHLKSSGMTDSRSGGR